MLDAALAGALAGYAIAIPVGAIAVLIIHHALNHGLRTGLAAASGAATADVVYAALAAFAGLWVSELMAPYEAPLQLLGGGILVGLGLRGLFAARSAREQSGSAEAHAATPRSDGRTYLALLALTLLNPATVIYFTALTVSLPFLGGAGERIAFAVAAGAASLSWQVVLALFGSALGRGSRRRLRTVTVAIGNGVIIVMGALIVVQPL